MSVRTAGGTELKTASAQHLHPALPPRGPAHDRSRRARPGAVAVRACAPRRRACAARRGVGGGVWRGWWRHRRRRLRAGRGQGRGRAEGELARACAKGRGRGWVGRSQIRGDALLRRRARIAAADLILQYGAEGRLVSDGFGKRLVVHAQVGRIRAGLRVLSRAAR